MGGRKGSLRMASHHMELDVNGCRDEAVSKYIMSYEICQRWLSFSGSICIYLHVALLSFVLVTVSSSLGFSHR